MSIRHCAALAAVMLLSFTGVSARQQGDGIPEALKVKEFTLSNGFKVYVNEDHSQPSVYGAVVVKAGSNDCPDTGIAHYFEHMMFKGTSRIGTTDYAAEKVYLDSIVRAYDLLAETTVEEERMKIQKDINRLGNEAAAYAIPNEFDRLVSRFGGSGLNAGTSYDYTVYYNTFAPQFLAQWCELYAERLREPVFRLFQSELETVYEEKNMYSDNPVQPALEAVLKEYFGDAPYSCPIIGTTENLKNPQLSKMAEFFDKYYVPRNMAVILCGDVTAEEARPFLEQTFGKLADKGPAPARTFEVKPIEGKNTMDIKVPVPLIKFGGRAFTAPKESDPDYIPLSVGLRLLTNESGSGLLDSLANSHKVMMATAMNTSFDDAGLMLFGYIPNIPFGSEKKAMQMCLDQIEKVKRGEFTDDILQELKSNLKEDEMRGYETIRNRGENLTSTFTRGITWEEQLARIASYDDVTREDVVRVMNKYFGDNYLEGHKKTGSYPKDKVSQPGYEAVSPKNSFASSAYADSLKCIPVEYIPRVVDLDKDVTRTPVSGESVLYSVQNKVNDIFELGITWYRGTDSDRTLRIVPDYLSLAGTDSLSLQQLKSTLRRLGAKMYFESDKNTFSASLSAPDRNLEEVLALLRHFIGHVACDDKAVGELKSAVKVSGRSFDKSNSDIASAVLAYVSRGSESRFLQQFNESDIKAVGAAGMVRSFKDAAASGCDFVYSGNRAPGEVASLLKEYLPSCGGERVTFRPVGLKEYSSPQVFIYDMPSARQNIIMTFQTVERLKNPSDMASLKLFGEYFGGSMYSILFQEMREFRSFAYTAHGAPVIVTGNLAEAPAAFMSYIGTQSDKTSDVLTVLDSLFREMPLREENAETARLTLLNEINNSFPSFRRIGEYVRRCGFEGYSEDPDAALVKLLPSMGTSDITSYFDSEIKGRPQVLMIVGNKKNLPMDIIQRWGPVTYLKKADIYR